MLHGSDLMDACRNIKLTEAGGKGELAELNICVGYIMGVVDGSTWASGWNANHLFPICIPVEVTREQLVRIVLKYGNAHPDELHAHAQELVTSALLQTFPCKE